MARFDVVIIGAGVSGLFAAMKLATTSKRILVIDSAKPLNERLSSLGQDIASNQTNDRYLGFGGLGISEGKYNFTNDFGGDLASKIGNQESLLYQQKVDQLLCEYGADKKALYNTFDSELAKRADQVGFKILSTKTRHLGTRLSTAIFQEFANYLSSKVEFAFNTTVSDIDFSAQQLLLTLANQEKITTKKVIIAVGRSGLNWLEPIAKKLAFNYENTRLDLGFRIEMHNKQLASLLQKVDETKLYFKSENYSATTYCMNPNGRVIAKYQDSMVMPDGQNCNEVGHSANLNFTLFIPTWFKLRSDADNYLKHTIAKINQQQGIIAAQRLADIDARFHHRKHHIEPTLSTAIFTNLSTIAPANYLHDTCDFLSGLEKLLGEPIDGNTILYAMDSKSYAPVIKTDQFFLTQVPNLYVIGDCSGITSSLSQAAASGLLVADHIVKSSS
ncbi:FAD-dependent oxidoreductase [Orbus wheelerorum]|uniref:NAD(P)/FAD-dependent oxidoreductase n=1 Tax=Orbus wheelerorum TaxID=3074111 RepID=UPI00370D0814